MDNVSILCFRLCIACQFILHNPQILPFEVSAANTLNDYKQVQPEQLGLTPPRSQKNKRPGYVPEITHFSPALTDFTREQVRYHCKCVLLSF